MKPEPATATPPWLAHRMLDLAEFRGPAEQVWDPCAGTGTILRAAAERGAAVEYLELNEGRAAALKAQGYTGRRGSMDRFGPQNHTTLVAMNPDFRGDKWISMLAWALQYRVPRLVCAVPGGWLGQLERGRQLPLHGAEQVLQRLQAAQEYRVHNLPTLAFYIGGKPVPTAVLYVRGH